MTAELRDQLQGALGPAYRVGQELTGGGMSRVFVVDDVELDRKLVAKLLPSELAAGVSVDRFRREIQLAARLQHPHIVPLLAAGARDGLLYYTMPFIEGESLRARVSREHELPVHDVVRILREVADALSYAHEHNVVHRDIKPDNVLLSGHHALVTDFGVSKAISTAASGSTLTSVGVALGTPSYMSPEQISADPSADHRADIYSLGALAYELLTGRPPFVGHTPHHVISAHLTQRPESIRTLRPSVPPELEQIVMRCLEKVPADRWQTAEEVLTQLESLATPRLGMPPTVVPSAGVPASDARSRRWWFVAGAAVTVLAIALVAMQANSRPEFATGTIHRVTTTPLLELHPAISPDGKLVAYAGGSIGRMHIYVRQIGAERAVMLSEGVPGDHRMPQWSADGRQVAFFAGDAVYVVPALGGQPRRVAPPSSSSWPERNAGSLAALSADFSRLAYVDDAGHLMLVSVAGGEPALLAEGIDVHSMTWSPEGERIAFVTNNPDFSYSRTSAGNVAPSAIWVVSASGKESGGEEAVRVTDAVSMNTSPVWTPDGNLLYVSNVAGGRDVYLQRLSSSGRPRGEPRRLTTGLNVHTISLSADGTRLAYANFGRRANVWAAPIMASGATPASALRAVTNENQLVEGAAVSHDGQWLVYDSNRGGRQQLFKIRVGGGEPIQLTQDATDHFAARWTRDDRHIVYHVWQAGTRDIAMIDAAGGGKQDILTSRAHEYYPDLSPDGRTLVLRYQPESAVLTKVALTRRRQNGWSDPEVVSDSANYIRWSPDGTRFAYVTTLGALVVGSERDQSRTTVLRPSSVAGGNARNLAWSRDGRTIFYISAAPNGDMSYWRLPVSGGRPSLVLALPADASARPFRVEFDADGRNLYFAMAQDDSDVWMMELTRR